MCLRGSLPSTLPLLRTLPSSCNSFSLIQNKQKTPGSPGNAPLGDNSIIMKDLNPGGLTAPAHKCIYALRIASAMCFIGHGTFGIITKPIWCNYFAVFGIGHDLAYHLMPVLGTIDILLGLSLLFYPTRAVLGWLVIWGAVTALLRPLSGEPFGEFIERAGNYGAPLALLLLSGWRPLWSRLDAHPQPDRSQFNRVDPMSPRGCISLIAGSWLAQLDRKERLAGPILPHLVFPTRSMSHMRSAFSKRLPPSQS